MVDKKSSCKGTSSCHLGVVHVSEIDLKAEYERSGDDAVVEVPVKMKMRDFQLRSGYQLFFFLDVFREGMRSGEKFSAKVAYEYQLNFDPFVMADGRKMGKLYMYAK